MPDRFDPANVRVSVTGPVPDVRTSMTTTASRGRRCAYENSMMESRVTAVSPGALLGGDVGGGSGGCELADGAPTGAED
jgi:hypothetical protein